MQTKIHNIYNESVKFDCNYVTSDGKIFKAPECFYNFFNDHGGEISDFYKFYDDNNVPIEYADIPKLNLRMFTLCCNCAVGLNLDWYLVYNTKTKKWTRLVRHNKYRPIRNIPKINNSVNKIYEFMKDDIKWNHLIDISKGNENINSFMLAIKDTNYNKYKEIIDKIKHDNKLQYILNNEGGCSPAPELPNLSKWIRTSVAEIYEYNNFRFINLYGDTSVHYYVQYNTKTKCIRIIKTPDFGMCDYTKYINYLPKKCYIEYLLCIDYITNDKIFNDLKKYDKMMKDPDMQRDKIIKKIILKCSDIPRRNYGI